MLGAEFGGVRYRRAHLGNSACIVAPPFTNWRTLDMFHPPITGENPVNGVLPAPTSQSGCAGCVGEHVPGAGDGARHVVGTQVPL